MSGELKLDPDFVGDEFIFLGFLIDASTSEETNFLAKPDTALSKSRFRSENTLLSDRDIYPNVTGRRSYWRVYASSLSFIHKSTFTPLRVIILASCPLR